MLADFEELVCFAAVCEAGSITSAAEDLGCSKAHVSRKLKDLETRVGSRLMHRTTRKITVTDAGEVIRSEALLAYQELKRLSNKARTVDADVSGRFTITASLSVCSHVLAPEMPELQAAFPDVRFHILPTNDQRDLVEEGIDMALRSGDIKDTDLIAHQVGRGRDVFFCREEDYPPDGFQIADLKDQSIIANPYSMTENQLRLIGGEQAVELRPGNMTLVSDYSLLVDLVGRMGGIGLAPDYCLQEHLLSTPMKRLFPHWRGNEWPLYMVYPFMSPLPRKLSLIAAFLRPRIQARLE